MTLEQTSAFIVIGLMMAAFIWGRFRYDLVACCSLLLALAVGIVPFDRAFSGFSDDIVIIVGSALMVSAAVARHTRSRLRRSMCRHRGWCEWVTRYGRCNSGATARTATA